MAAESWKHLYEKNNFCHLVMLALVIHSNPCNFKIFKTVMKYFLKHYRAQISF